MESTDQRTLNAFKKDLSCEESREAIRLLNRAGIVSECSFLLGLPEESPESIEETLRLAFHYDPRFPHFILFAPWPYEGMYEGLREYIEVEDYSKYNFVEPVMRSRHMSRQQLQEAVISCYWRYYSQKVPEYLGLRDPFLRRYLLKAVELMAERSFLSKHRQKLGAMAHGWPWKYLLDEDRNEIQVCP